MRTRSRWIAAAAAWCLAVGAACGSGEVPGGPPPPQVVVATARLGTVPDRREYVGNVRALNQVEVRARVRGYLLERLYTEGAVVAQGDVLFRIDPEPFQVAVARARGELARVQATVERARRDFLRVEELLEANVTSRAELDARRAEFHSARAEVASAEAAVRGAELELSYCTVTAPLAGRIGRALVDVGNLVGESGQDTVLAEIVQVDPVHVYFAPTELDRLDVIRGAREGRIPEERAGAIPVQIRLGDGTPFPHEGIVDYVDPTIEPTRGTVTVRAQVPNPEGDLKPGEFVRVTAVFPDLEDAVLVPERAILDEQGGTYVLVVGAESRVEYRRVTAGIAVDGMQQVREGLAAGERVIVEGVQNARPGMQVQAAPSGEAADAAPSG